MAQGPCSAAGSSAEIASRVAQCIRAESRFPDAIHLELPRMTSRPEIVFQTLSADLEPTVIVLAGEDVALGSRGREIDQRTGGVLGKAAEAAQYKGRKKSTVEVLAPPRLSSVNRVVLVGTGKTSDLSENDWVLLGGTAGGAISARKTKSASIIAEAADNGGTKPEAIAAMLAFGAALRHYDFRKYLTKRNSDDENGEPDGLQKLVIHSADPDKARAAFARYEAVANGIITARDLVNEPANALGPVEFADRVEGADKARRRGRDARAEPDRRSSKMGALLAVGAGQRAPAACRRHAVARRQGEARQAARLRRQGRRLRHRRHLDQAGRRHGGHEGRHGRRGRVVGLMQALAARKAKVNAIGIIGLVENMPVGHRDSVRATSSRRMSGQTIEVLNTDAEGRLVLADCSLVRAGALQAAADDRSRDADRRDHGGARQGVCRASSATMTSWPPSCSSAGRARARRCGACRSDRHTTR